MSDETKNSSQNSETNDVKNDKPTDDFVTTHHSLGDLNYTATTGRMVISEEVTEEEKFKGRKPKAEVSITSYTLDNADVKQRPVTFAFNGGPGSSSVWLHLGVLGPRRVNSGDVGAMTPPPYEIVDNPETLLNASDLVFIDPVSTGYSRPVEEEKADPYHGFQGDLESVAEVIRLWTSRHQRWMSPKFLIGESYGGTRAAALSDYLQSTLGMFLNGVMLIAPALNLETLYFMADRSNLPDPLFLPLYAATAHYHGLHPDRELDELVAEARDFADEYTLILNKGHRATEAERDAAIHKIASLAAVSPDYVDRANLRLEHTRFYAEILRHKRLVTGRLDTRFTGPADNYIHEQMSTEPFFAATMPAYTAAFNHYIRAELEYANDQNYRILTGDVHPWSYKEFEGKSVDVTDRLSSAMRANPFLKVHVAAGRYDGGVPVEAINYTMDHLLIPDSYRENIEFKEYPAGHMMYLHDESRSRQLADLTDFVRRSSNR
ncbi:S10 family peptidase [Haloglycomyces albus]|uniref:S10 family peptidase n=1 Tax=Haloglycomyces albus TaxID=526067 RepID=UPI00046CC1E6|nr:peptidase S10 [Haloglycomyces albus]